MRKYISVLLLTTSLSLTSACTDLQSLKESGDTTKMGAATGGALGAGLGAIVGSQSGDAGVGLVLGAAAGTATGGLVANKLEVQQRELDKRDQAIQRTDARIAEQRSTIERLTHQAQDQVSFRNGGNGVRAGSAATLDAGAGSPRARMQLPPGAVPVTRLRPADPGATVGSWQEAPSRGSFGTYDTDAGGAARQVESMRERDVNLYGGSTGASVERAPAARIARPVGVSNPPAAALSDDFETNAATNTRARAFDGIEERPIEQLHEVSADAEPLVETAPVARSDDTAALGKTPRSGSDQCAKAQEEIGKVNAESDTADKLFHFRRALRLCPDNPSYHTGLGKIYSSLNRKSDAEFEFREALRLDPGNTEAKRELEKF